MSHFLISQDYSSKRWMVSEKRRGVSANVWGTRIDLGFFHTAREAKARFSYHFGANPTWKASNKYRGRMVYTTELS